MIFHVLSTDNFYQTFLITHCIYCLQIYSVMKKPVCIKVRMLQSMTPLEQLFMKA